MGRLRAENGHPEPYGVKYWELDNETWRWFSKEEYAEYVKLYAEAMHSVDPTIQIGICSYHTFSDEIEDILEMCGKSIDFIADRMCEPFNIKRKISIVQNYNKTHQHQIYYTDTEALQNRDLTLAPYTKHYYNQQSGLVQETMKFHGNIHKEVHYGTISCAHPCTFEVPAFSFSEIVLYPEE